MATPLDSALGKLRWAMIQTKTLDADIRRAFKEYGQPSWAAKKKYNAKEKCFIVTVDRAVRPHEDWPFMAADALQNFRAALNHLAWVVVPPKSRTISVQYPFLMTEPKNFRKAVKGRLPCVSSTHLAIISRYQPYRWGGAAALHPFVPLQKLTNADKHEQVQLTLFRSSTITFRVPVDSLVHCGSPRIEFSKKGFLNPGAEVGRVYVTPQGGKPDLKVKIESKAGMAIEDGTWVEQTLDAIGGLITNLLAEFKPIL